MLVLRSFAEQLDFIISFNYNYLAMFLIFIVAFSR